MIIWGVVFDFFDGLIARALHVSSKLGKQLDSLADMVTFGVLPAMIIFNIMESVKYITLIIPLLSALRLAKFNISTEQSDKFIGIATTCYGLLVSTLVIAAIKDEEITSIICGDIIMSFVVVMSVLLVLPIPYMSLKFHDFSITHNWPRYLFLTMSLFIVYVYGFKGIPISLILYIILGHLLQRFIDNSNDK